MSDRTDKPDSPAEEALHGGGGPVTGAVARLVRLFSALRAWTYGHWFRGVVVAGAMVSLIALTMAGWAYLASIALHTGNISIDSALESLDNGQYGDARAAVMQMLQSNLMRRSDYGGPLFVLGAVKIHEAENEASAERRRLEHLVASRYLTEARAYGFPRGRVEQGSFMLGKSLVESGQFTEGLEVLEETAAAADGKSPVALATHRYLAETCLRLPNPRLQQALRHNEEVLAAAELSDSERAEALALAAECKSRLKEFDEARRCVQSIPASAVASSAIKLLLGKILIDEAGSALLNTAATESVPEGKFNAKLDEAIQHLQSAADEDTQKAHITRQANYEIGRAYELQGNRESALKQHARTRQFFGESFEGLAASLSEADLLREAGNIEAASLGYRRVLELYKSIPIYYGAVLPRSELRARMMAALKDLVERRYFAEALTLVDRLQPLFSRTEQLELRGGTLERWGTLLLSEAPDADAIGHRDEQKSDGLEKLRAAGVALEELAELRFASQFYTADLWHSAETYYSGHSFTSAVRLLNKYLNYEPELRNAEALLRLGQAHLAIGEILPSIAAFEECIEFHPLDGSSYQARIDCSKAYWHQGDTARAEQLLRENLAGASLKPNSREWKDSLFELAMLLHETGQHQEAIAALEEAIERYPQDPQRLLAQYVLGESYRRWAQEAKTRGHQAHTSAERDKALQLANERLTAALKQFEEVQVSITLKTHDLHSDPLMGTMLRNCYMLEGTVLFDLGRYKEAIEAFSNVASLYPDNPFVLETFVQIANCWRRLGEDPKARGAIQQAQIVLQGLPGDADFSATTALNREEWNMLLADMSKW